MDDGIEDLRLNFREMAAALFEIGELVRRLSAEHIGAVTVLDALLKTHPNPRAVLAAQMERMDHVMDLGDADCVAAAQRRRDGLLRAINTWEAEARAGGPSPKQ